MSRHSFFVFLSSALLFVLLISLACPMAASADDGTPPPPATEEPVQPPVAEPVVSEVPPPATEAPVVVQESVATEEPFATEAPVEQANDMLPIAEEEGEGTDEEVTVADFLEAAPEGTDVVVLDENGEALPLASVEAAEIAAVVDPMWCPDGQNPGNDMDDGIQNCSITFATPQELIDAMDATDPGVGPRSFYEWNGTIYFTTNPGGSFVLTSGDVDLADYDALKRFSLTLQGGWNGATGASYLLTGSQTEFTNNRIQIGTSANPWGGNITINNIKISPGTVSTEPGLAVYTDGRILLDYVDVLDNNSGSGAVLDNDSLSLPVNRNVIVRHSNFNGNAGTGLQVASNGIIRLVDVGANENAVEGASLTTNNGEVSISGGSTFNGNLNNGLSVNAYGDITLLNVLARDNLGDGAVLDNTSGDGTVSVTSGRFIHNDADGLEVSSNSDITLLNVLANRNTAVGAYLDNSSGTGVINVSSSTFGGGVTTGNGDYGLDAISNGSITLTDVSATGNDMIGASLLSGDIVEVSTSNFDQNGDAGLGVFSNGSIILTGVTASGNAGDAGALLLNVGPDPVQVSDSHFDENSAGGLTVLSLGGQTTLSNVTANGNTFTGAILLSAGAVLISNSNFNGNATDLISGGLGLGISSAENILLNNVSVSNNSYGDGAYFVTDGNATIICSQFKGNLGIGVDGIDVTGVFTLNDVTFSGNGVAYIGTPVFTSGGCGIVKTKSHKSSSSLSLRIVPVGGGEQVELDCGAYSGTKLILPNGDQVILPCPILDQGMLMAKAQDQLPGPLEDPFELVSALDVEVILAGETVPTVPAGMTVDFVIPDGQSGADLAILRWDVTQSQWIEVPGGYDTGDGRFAATSSFTGVFVLVTK